MNESWSSTSSEETSSNRNGPPHERLRKASEDTSGSESTIQYAMDEIHRLTETNYEQNRDAPAADYERQALLLMLLASVCSLHDVTPKTFTVHLLELFERGILDRESIQFLFDLGLLPSVPTPSLKLITTGETEQTNLGQLALTTSNPKRTLAQQRSLEVSAIRSSLETLDIRKKKEDTKSETEGTSWLAENHPLSLSRYQRDFEQIKVLASGGFGVVFHARSRMDARDYAVKRIIFSASGYSHESIQRVVREVQCLAVCDHPHVVRYYTSWLEPGWMTGNMSTTTEDHAQNQLLLQVAQDDYASASGYETTSDGFSSLYRQSPFSPPRRQLSSDSRVFTSDHEDSVIEWAIGEDSKDDMHLLSDWNGASTRHNSPTKRKSYSYQICLFIQMELCQSYTLAEWIREENLKPYNEKSRVEDAIRIFRQICCGLDHIHDRGIVHRDLKPANVFANLVDRDTFMIGDFGLSKIIDDWVEENEFAGVSGTNRARGHLTAGLGTVSYAAPEQISSNSYNRSVDIFSLGLILLEMISPFSTEHERVDIIRACKLDRVLPDVFDRYPKVKEIILQMTLHVPEGRPTVGEILKSHLWLNFSSECLSDVSTLQETVKAQAETLAKYEQLLENKDLEIAALKKKLNLLEKMSKVK